MKPNRREFFRTMGVGAAGVGVGPALLASGCAPAAPGGGDDPVLQIGEDIAVVETKYGRVRGYILRGIYHFLGIPYGADTSGTNRFMAPQPPKPWADVYPAVWWGNSAPVWWSEGRHSHRYNAFVYNSRYSDMSENCLAINVWTPGYSDGKKRPVMVYLHGGGFIGGNGGEWESLNGENLCRFGDVVFCSLNHRLGPLGYLNLAGVGGERYAASGNAGMLDLVLALEWIRDNIERFGGDPGSVTIMGASAGGAKVTILTAMPSAKGLIHKAVALSGPALLAAEKDHSEGLGAAVVREAGLSPSQVDRLQQMPWREYYPIALRASARYNGYKGDYSDRHEGLRLLFNPVVDGRYLPQHPYHPDPAPTAADVPMLICTTVEEGSPSRYDAALENVTLDTVVERVRYTFGDKSRDVVQAYAQAFPDRRPIEIWAMAGAGRIRKQAVAAADVKSRQPAPVYLAWFGWHPPLFDSRLRAFHGLDISFWYYNTDRMLTQTGGGKRPRALAEKMARSLVQFMRTGDPNGGGLPTWPRYTTQNGETMVLDDVSEVKNDPDREARKVLP
jgi:para-nitrobenzyl esterase